MNEKELLAVLKTESILATAREHGAKQAYQQEAIRQARGEMYDKGIKPGDQIVVHFTDGDVVYEYRKIEWGWGSDDEPALFGTKVLKSGKLSKVDYGQKICGISYLHHVTKKAPNAALRGDSGLIAGVPLESTVRGEKSTPAGR